MTAADAIVPCPAQTGRDSRAKKTFSHKAKKTSVNQSLKEIKTTGMCGETISQK